MFLLLRAPARTARARRFASCPPRAPSLVPYRRGLRDRCGLAGRWDRCGLGRRCLIDFPPFRCVVAPWVLLTVPLARVTRIGRLGLRNRVPPHRVPSRSLSLTSVAYVIQLRQFSSVYPLCTALNTSKRLVPDPGVQEPPKYSQSLRKESTSPAQARAEEPAPAGLPAGRPRTGNCRRSRPTTRPQPAKSRQGCHRKRSTRVRHAATVPETRGRLSTPCTTPEGTLQAQSRPCDRISGIGAP